MKKLLLVLVGVFCLASFAMAKDGPFPIKLAVGTWVSQNVPGLKVRIIEGAHTATSVQVLVSITNAQGVEIARGVSRHRMDDPNLIMTMVNASGHQFTVVFHAVEDERYGSGSSNSLKLVLDLGGYYWDNSPNQDEIVLGRQ